MSVPIISCMGIIHCLLPMAAFTPQQQSRVAVTEAVRPAKPNILTAQAFARSLPPTALTHAKKGDRGRIQFDTGKNGGRERKIKEKEER